MRIILRNLADTRRLAYDLARKWVKRSGPLVIALYGNLGAGKTTFVQFFAKALGVKEKVASPTFLIIRTFALPKKIGRFKFLTHIDTYRLRSAKELIALGLKDILKDKENIVVIEWAEKLERYLPRQAKKVYFEVAGEKKRKIIVKISNS